jgi:MinD superfamily P-loop ATPase
MSTDRPDAAAIGRCPSCSQELQGHEFNLAADGSWQTLCSSCGACVTWSSVQHAIDLRDTVVT